MQRVKREWRSVIKRILVMIEAGPAEFAPGKCS